MPANSEMPVATQVLPKWTRDARRTLLHHVLFRHHLLFRRALLALIPGARRAFWRARLASQGDGYARMVLRDPYQSWEKNCAPELEAKGQLIWALYIAFADPDHELVRRFLTRGVEIADRALAERKFENEFCRGAFPGNVAVALRTKAQCLSILTGVTQESLFREASKHFLQFCHQEEGEEGWHPIAQNYYLSGIRSALLAGDHELAQAVQRAGQAADHREESRILEVLIAAARSGAGLSTRTQHDLNKLFVRTRNPLYNQKPPLTVIVGPFEIACVRDKYVVSDDRKVNWPRVIADFAA